MADPSKTESATPRRREEARKRGQVARSVELNTALGILGSLVVLQLAASFMFGELARVSTQAWGHMDRLDLNMSEVQRQALVFGIELAYILSPLLLGVFLVGV